MGVRRNQSTVSFWIVFFCTAAIFVTGCSRNGQQSDAIQLEQLIPYTHCTFPDGLKVVAVDPLAPGVTARTVETPRGPKLIPMLAGIRIMFAYPATDFFANIKVEELPASQYQKLKQSLVENFEYVLASSPSDRRNASPVSFPAAFDVRGLDRDKLEGGTLGFYLIFDDKKQIATSIYFLNQEPQQRKFQSMDEYRRLRDQFLARYGSCIARLVARQET